MEFFVLFFAAFSLFVSFIFLAISTASHQGGKFMRLFLDNVVWSSAYGALCSSHTVDLYPGHESVRILNQRNASCSRYLVASSSQHKDDSAKLLWLIGLRRYLHRGAVVEAVEAAAADSDRKSLFACEGWGVASNKLMGTDWLLLEVSVELWRRFWEGGGGFLHYPWP